MCAKAFLIALGGVQGKRLSGDTGGKATEAQGYLKSLVIFFK